MLHKEMCPQMPLGCPQDLHTVSGFRLKHIWVTKIFYKTFFCSMMCGFFFLLLYFEYNYRCPYGIDSNYSEEKRVQGIGQIQTGS